jgi:hypothetical protein
MAVISIRLNKEEEKIMNYLATFYEEDKSTLIKHSIKDMYEDIIDNKVINEYEEKENKEKQIFISSEDILKELS